jgi:hypothetical protein
VPRQRTARLPVLDAHVRRSEGSFPRTSRALRARLIAVALVLVSIALVTVYFRESEGGALHGAQRIGVSVAMPFEVAGERVARPFKDAYGWAADLFGAKSENEKLKKEVEALRSERIAATGSRCRRKKRTVATEPTIADLRSLRPRTSG